MIIAIDFDGTLCERAWPNIGAEKPRVVRMAKELRAAGNKLILWTCREGERLKEALEWCADRELYFDAVNDNIPELVKLYDCNSRKVSADMYIDDKSMNELEALQMHEYQMIEAYANNRKCFHCESRARGCNSDECSTAKQKARYEYKRIRENEILQLQS